MKVCWANYLLVFVIVVLGTASMLSACGKKGPLYLPEEAPAVQKDTPKKEKQKQEQEETKTN